MVSLRLFLLVEVRIYTRSCTSHSTVIAELAVALFESTEWDASLERNGTKEGFLREIPNNVVLKARLRKSQLDTCSGSKSLARDILLQLLLYQMLISGFPVVKHMYITENKEEITQAQEMLLERLDGTE